MAHRKIKRNYDILSNYSYFVPDGHGILMIFIWFLVGALLGNLVTLPIMALFGDIESATMYATVVAYPLMFIPPMIYSAYRSRSNSLFGVGYKMSNDHYKPMAAWFCIILVAIATCCTAFVADPVTSLLPPMPKWLEDTLKGMTGGNIYLDLLCVSIFAPFFEEWLCRGMVLRGLLYFPHRDKDGKQVQGIKPVWAIVISAAFFAVIHLNPWQAIAAFTLGCLFGYVYYKTGSIKLTMLMHCVNNTVAVILSRIDAIEDCENFTDMMSPGLFVAVLAFCLAFIAYTVSKFKTVEQQSPNGNCDEERAIEFQPDPEN